MAMNSMHKLTEIQLRHQLCRIRVVVAVFFSISFVIFLDRSSAQCTRDALEAFNRIKYLRRARCAFARNQ